MSEDVETKDDLIGTTIQDRYRVISLVGEGGMGKVYKVEHILIGRCFALKVLYPTLAQEPDLAARFHREARIAAAIGDKHITEVNDMGQLPNGSKYIVLELLEGHDLGVELKKIGLLTISRAVKIAIQCCRALGKAHNKGIVHRDIKPDNIFLDNRQDESDFVKILDFGISKIRQATIGQGDLLTTKTGTTLGTPCYMSPEQATGDREVDTRTDIYAMGVVLFQMLTGRLPFEATTYPILIIRIIHSPPPPLRKFRLDIPIELEKVIHRAMAKNPADRFKNMDDFVQALTPFTGLENEPRLVDSALISSTTITPATCESAIDSPKRFRNKSRLYRNIGFGLLGTIAFVGLTTIAIKNDPHDTPVPKQVSPISQPLRNPNRPVESQRTKEASPLPSPSQPSNEVSEVRPLSRSAPASRIDRQPKRREKKSVLQNRPSKTVTVTPRLRARDGKNRPILRKTNEITEVFTPTSMSQKRRTISIPSPISRKNITIFNQRRAMIRVTLKCADMSRTIQLSAGEKQSVEISLEDCSVYCKGLGHPRCPATLKKDASSLLVQ